MEAPPPDAEPRTVILDVDTGIDDMLALLIAATSPELNLRGVTCVAGNVEIHHVARNTGKILRMVGRGDVPVSIGAARPLQRRPIRKLQGFRQPCPRRRICRQQMRLLVIPLLQPILDATQEHVRSLQLLDLLRAQQASPHQ